ncbi:MAG TPA: FAD-binding oxidoreductase [Reyranella sp.]|nr:FAD-binding oxidoreductase [Reyranella sp.]
MPASYSKKRERDRALFEKWDRLPKSCFAGIPLEAMKDAQRKLIGHIVFPGDPDYDTDRKIFNPVFDPYPAFIFYCEAVGDVAMGLDFAHRYAVGFTVRSSGHCSAGFCASSGILIDVSALNSITVDTQSDPPTVTVGPGTNFGALQSTLQGYGLHVPGGECPDVCVAGYVQGGGYGYTSVTFGMSCDNVQSFEVVLAGGGTVIASPEENADLWWAMQGGTGGNFGVLTSVTYSLVPIDPMFGWALVWPLQTSEDIANASEALMVLQKSYMLNSPYAPNMNIQCSFCYQNWIDPSLPPPPPDTPLLPYFMVRGLWVGDESSGQTAIKELQQVPGCFTQWTMVSTFLDLNNKLLNYPQSMPDIQGSTVPYFDKSSRYVTTELSSDQWGELLKLFAASPNNCAYGYLEFYGGNINAAPPNRNAFIHRTSAYNATMDTLWYTEEQKEACAAFISQWNAALEPVWNGEIYQNYCSLNSVPDYPTNYWGAALATLWDIKTKYDPENFFTFAQAICPPSGSTPAIDLPTNVAEALKQPIKYLIPPPR